MQLTPFEIALVLVRLDHVASFIVNATSEAVEQQRLPWRGLSPGTWMLAKAKRSSSQHFVIRRRPSNWPHEEGRISVSPARYGNTGEVPCYNPANSQETALTYQDLFLPETGAFCRAEK